MIRLDNISKTFRDGDTQVQALKNISFEVNKGELVAIIGKSGSGKSTLLNILGLLDKQTDGDYYIDGKKYLPYRSVKSKAQEQSYRLCNAGFRPC